MGHGIELSIDGGATWKTLKDTGADTINCVEFGAVMRPTNRVVYFAEKVDAALWGPYDIRCSLDGGVTDYKVFRTTDWAAQQPFVFAAAPSNPAVCYCGTRTSNQDVDSTPCHLYKTTDWGASWIDLGQAEDHNRDMKQIAVHPTNPDIVVITNSTHAYYSTDGGVTRPVIPTNGAWFLSSGGACIFPTGEVYRSDTWVYVDRLGHETWKSHIEKLDGSYPYTYEWPSDPSNSYPQGWMAVAMNGGSRGLYVGINPTQPYDCLLTKDRGATWTPVNNAVLTCSIDWGIGRANYPRCAVSLSGKILYASLPGNGLYKSTDDGATWDKINTYGDMGYVKKHTVLADPVEENWVWYLKTTSNDTYFTYATLFLSKDAGATWHAKRTFKHGLHNLVWDGCDPSIAYMAGGA